MAPVQSDRPFPTVLVARKTSDPPTELEIILKQWAQRIRIVTHLSGGAHFLLPGKETVAVRAYHAKDITQLEKKCEEKIKSSNASREDTVRRYFEKVQKWEDCSLEEEKQRPRSMSSVRPNSSTKRPASKGAVDSSQHEQEVESVYEYDVDGLCAFRDSFKYPVVFFILSTEEMQRDQLERSDSVVMRAQRFLASPLTKKKIKSRENQDGKIANEGSTAKVFIVSNLNSVLSTLLSVMESIQPEKRALKRKFFEKEAAKSALPNPETGLVPSETALAAQTAGAFRAWARRFDVPAGDAGVLLSVLGTLSKITSADSSVLKNIPINRSSKEILMNFFGTEPSDANRSHREDSHSQYSEFPLETMNSSMISNESTNFSAPSTSFATENTMSAHLPGQNIDFNSMQSQAADPMQRPINYQSQDPRLNEGRNQPRHPNLHYLSQSNILQQRHLQNYNNYGNNWGGRNQVDFDEYSYRGNEDDNIPHRTSIAPPCRRADMFYPTDGSSVPSNRNTSYKPY